MPNIPTITWRQLTGNKFSKAIDSAMVSDVGCLAPQKIRRVGDIASKTFNVHYDSEYLLQFILRKFIKSLSVLGRERFSQLVSEAWDLYDKEMLNPQGLSENSN